MQSSRLLSQSPNSPSFGCFSAAIADRVVEEFRDQEPQSDSHADESEFAFDYNHCLSDRIVTADEIFSNGKIRPVYPYDQFSCPALGGNSSAEVKAQDVLMVPSPPPTITRKRRPPLRILMREDRDAASCSSSSDANGDLVGISPETYCVWTPKQSINRGPGDDHLHELSYSPSQREIKSNFGVSSKRWKLRNILYARSISEVKRSTSDGEEAPSPPAGNCSGNGESYCERGDQNPKRRSYLPYRKDIIGILRNVNGQSRRLLPF